LEEDKDAEVCDIDYEDDDGFEEEQSKRVSKIILLVENAPDLLKDDWIAVHMGATWYPGQFVQFDSVSEELEVNFLHRSSSNEKWFVWPSLQARDEEDKEDKEDKGWVEEKNVFYRLGEPKEGRRQTLIFNEYDEVEKAFKDM